MILGGAGTISNLQITSELPLIENNGISSVSSAQVNFFDVSFWQNFTSNSLATLLGVLLGIPIALWVNRWIENRGKKQKKSDLLQLFHETLEKNKSLLEQMSRELDPKYIIFYNVDTSLLESTASLKYEIIDNSELNRRLDTLRYELQHIHRKVELQLEIAYSALMAMSNYLTIRANLISATKGHLPRIIEEIDQVLKIIDEQNL